MDGVPRSPDRPGLASFWHDLPRDGRLLLSTVLARIEEQVGEGVVTEIVVQGPAGPSWKKGPLSAGGRGPRDTYG